MTIEKVCECGEKFLATRRDTLRCYSCRAERDYEKARNKNKKKK